MNKSTYRNFNTRWSSRLNQKVWTPSDIASITKTLNSARYAKPELKTNIEGLKQFLTHYCSTEAYGYGDCWGEVFHFARPYKITKQQSDFGIQWLREFTFKKNGELRKQAEGFSSHMIQVIKTFKRFEFVGVLEIKNQYGSNHYLPVYRTIGSKGQYFDYSPVHWGQPIISNEGKAGAQ